jgi:hypothetical protein
MAHIFYDGFDDGRACSPCECGPPVGSECLAFISMYRDAACTDLGWSTHVGLDPWRSCYLSDMPFPPLNPLPIESAVAEPPIYTPGTCTAMGGEPIGAASAIGPSTVCCRD